MTFNLAWTYAQFLPRLCIKCNMYLKCIMDSLSDSNGHHMVSRYMERVRPSDIFRLGIHTYRFTYTCRDIVSMDASFCSILPSKVKISLFCLNVLPTIAIIVLQMYCYCKCSVALLRGAVGWSALCGCGIS